MEYMTSQQWYREREREDVYMMSPPNRILKIYIKYSDIYINARPMTSDTIRRICKIRNIKNKYKIF